MRITASIIFLCAALGTACGNDGDPAEVLGPEPLLFTTVQITPPDAALSSAAPGNTLQLSVAPLDQHGELMLGAAVAAYSSTAPSVAVVDGSGLVTGRKAGTAKISARLTLGGVTRTASMNVVVGIPPAAQPTVFAGLKLTPSAAILFDAAPGNRLQLTVVPLDPQERVIPGAVEPSYSSTNPSVATVDNSGLVTAVAPGTAEIIATLTLGEVTRTKSMTVAVGTHGETATGLYDLTAQITTFDPAWGDLQGYRYTATVALQQSSLNRGRFTGTFSDFRLFDANGVEQSDSWDGTVVAVVDAEQITIELLPDDEFRPEWWGRGVGSETIEGWWGCCGHIGGVFTLERRQSS